MKENAEPDENLTEQSTATTQQEILFHEDATCSEELLNESDNYNLQPNENNSVFEDKTNLKTNKKQSVVEYTKRIAFLLVGLIIMAFGVAFSINAQLGTSPVSGIPYVLSLTSKLSVGVTTIIVNTLIVLLQIPVMRKKFKLVRLLQIPVCTVFGLLIDLASLCIQGILPEQYWAKWLLCILGIVLVAVGVSFEMTANVITLAGEGLVQAICSVCPIKFGYMKVIVDVSFVVIAVAISFIFLHGLYGVREGTAAAAVFVGLLAKQFNKAIKPLGDKLFKTSRATTSESR